MDLVVAICALLFATSARHVELACELDFAADCEAARLAGEEPPAVSDAARIFLLISLALATPAGLLMLTTRCDLADSATQLALVLELVPLLWLAKAWLRVRPPREVSNLGYAAL